MGIHKFYGRWLSKVDGNKNQKKSDDSIIQSRMPPNIGSLFMDMNGIFHNAAQMVYCYGEGNPDDEKTKRNNRDNKDFLKIQRQRKSALSTKTAAELEIEMLNEIIQKIIEIITTINPSDNVVLAVDGVAPMAKITQQRKRRYEAARESKSGGIFDSNCISPGTEFMMKLDSVIQYWIADSVKNNRFTFKNIVYSSHMVPGEGEHKIFYMLRNNHIEINPYKTNVVYGKDADLVMLTLLSDVNYLYLCREDYKEFVNIDMLRLYLVNNMTIKGYFDLPVEQVCRDFVLIMYLVGNDFVPDTIYFTDVKKVIDDMITDYQSLELTLTDTDGQIIWTNLAKFLKKFSRREVRYLEQMAKESDKFEYPFPILDASVTKEKYKNELLETYEYKTIVNMDKYKELWYDRALKPNNEMGRSILNIEVDSSRIDDMCLEYCKALQWILQYYTKGQKAVSSRFVYIYHFNPLISDLAEMMERIDKEILPTASDVIHSPEDPKITPIHQLIAVMPPKSWNLIPQPYRALMPLRFADIAPEATGFEILIEGKSKNDAFISTAILSIVDPSRIDRDILDYPIPIQYKEQISKFIKIFHNPRAPRGYAGLKNAYKELKVHKSDPDIEPKAAELESLEKIVDYDDIHYQPDDKEIFEVDTKAKVEPKSAAQMERIIRSKIKSKSITKMNIKNFTKPTNFMWVSEDLI